MVVYDVWVVLGDGKVKRVWDTLILLPPVWHRIESQSLILCRYSVVPKILCKIRYWKHMKELLIIISKPVLQIFLNDLYLWGTEIPCSI